MPSAIVIGGRVHWANFRLKTKPVDWGGRDRNGARLEAAPIADTHRKAPWRAGVPIFDRQDQLEYRCVGRGVLSPLEGWATAGFWMKRWGISRMALLELARRGWIDAAAEEGSAIRRFRVRDERMVKASQYFRRARQTETDARAVLARAKAAAFRAKMGS